MPVRVNTLRTAALARRAQADLLDCACRPTGDRARSISGACGSARGAGEGRARPPGRARRPSSRRRGNRPARPGRRRASSCGISPRSMPSCRRFSMPGSIVTRRLRSSAAVFGSTLHSRSSIVCTSSPATSREPSPSARCTRASAAHPRVLQHRAHQRRAPTRAPRGGARLASSRREARDLLALARLDEPRRALHHARLGVAAARR